MRILKHLVILTFTILMVTGSFGVLFSKSNNHIVLPASWTYEVKFKLASSAGEVITSYHLKQYQTQFFTLDDGYHIDHQLSYDDATQQFTFEQRAIVPNNVIVMVNGQDTMFIQLETRSIDLGTIIVLPGQFEVSRKAYYQFSQGQEVNLTRPQKIISFEREELLRIDL